MLTAMGTTGLSGPWATLPTTGAAAYNLISYGSEAVGTSVANLAVSGSGLIPIGANSWYSIATATT